MATKVYCIEGNFNNLRRIDILSVRTLGCCPWVFVPPTYERICDTLLPVKLSHLSEKVQAVHSEAQFCGITVDSWTSRRVEGYFGVTCHVIDDSFVFHTFLLACCHLLGRHTGSSLSLKTSWDHWR